ncbi:MAG: cardiolipin synthase [Clostridia bacterium]|nr:cardiolipin synthase [Clostridia bacterium]
MRKLLKTLLTRRFIVCFLLLVQILLIVFLIWFRASRIILSVLNLLSLIIIIYVINRRDKPAYKIVWIIIMLTFPLFGGLLYLILTWQVKSGKFRKSAKERDDEAASYLPVNKEVKEEFNSQNPQHAAQVNYLTDFARFPMYKNTGSEFYSPGEKFFSVFLEELEKAKEFIFIEYFIISPGSMWDRILDILKRKAEEGVEIRVMYDDMGCISLLPQKYYKELEKFGIKCVAFNPFRPIWSSVQNNRDHRKIVIIDSKVAVTGGINIADEYINEKKRFGYWKDCAVIVRGEAVRSFTVMFLQLWNASKNTKEDFSIYLAKTTENSYCNGYIIPYCDAPTDDENVCEHVYLQIINNARKYVYIETPYFIVDDSMLSAFILAAKSGVDIRIITPGIPDKKFVHLTTRSYYYSLIEAGVKIYEYTPGFIHSKVVISDDDTATVGTANFDFRSLYLHFECGELIFNSSTVEEMKKDFLGMLPLCHEVTVREAKRNIFVRFGQSVLRIIAPLL